MVAGSSPRPASKAIAVDSPRRWALRAASSGATSGTGPSPVVHSAVWRNVVAAAASSRRSSSGITGSVVAPSSSSRAAPGSVTGWVTGAVAPEAALGTSPGVPVVPVVPWSPRTWRGSRSVPMPGTRKAARRARPS